MRVLYLAQQLPFPPHGNGFTVRSYNILQGLATQHEVHLVAFSDAPVDSREIESLEAICATVRTISLRPHHRRRADQYMSALPADCQQYVRAAREDGLAGDFDLVHAEGAFMGPVARVRADLPALVSPSDALSLLEWQLVARTPGLKRLPRFVRWAKTVGLERSYRRLGCCVVVTEKDAAHLRRLSGVRVVVIPNGVDTDYFRPQRLAVGPPTILFTGVLSYPPNVDAATFFAKEVFPKIRTRHPDCIFRVVGRAPVPEVRTLHDPEGGVDIVGEVPDLRPYMNQASVYVSPLRLGAGIKNKVLEAIAMELPLVATPLSVDGIEIGPGTDFLLADGVDQLSEAVSSLLRNADERESMGKRGRNKVLQEYGWAKAVAAYSALYRELLEEREQ